MRIAITTLGCKINQYDSAVIQSRLEDKHSFVAFDEVAECYVINTCTVTDRADWEARQLVRRAKRRNPAAKVLVTGCYAQVNSQEVAEVPGVDFVVGLNRLDDLLRFVESVPTGGEQRIAVSDVKRERGVPVLGTSALPGHTRAFLKIQEGCNYSCTYCIIPTARGLSRSVTPSEVMEQVRRLAGAGYKEIVLTGIHLGGYGQDLNPKIDLTALVEMIADSGLISRLRLSSLDPREVPDRLLDLIAAAKTICPHLHICAQAGDNEILKQMRRNYDTAYYRDLLRACAPVCPRPRWAVTSSWDFPARATPSLKILWSILTRCRSLISTFSPIRRAAAPPRSLAESRGRAGEKSASAAHARARRAQEKRVLFEFPWPPRLGVGRRKSRRRERLSARL